MAFTTVLINALIALVYMAFGFSVVKMKKAFSDHAKSFSGILLYVCSPCMIIGAFQTIEFSAQTTIKMGEFFLTTLLIQLLFFGILFLIFHKKYDDAKYRILTAGAFFGNVGFFGLPLVTGLFPDEPIVACYSTLFVASMNFLVFTIGVFLITKDKKYISFKSAFLNPTTISVLIALPLYFFQVKFPAPIQDTVTLLGKMTTPMCMFVLGLRLASMNFKEVFGQPFAYVVCALKLVVFPLFGYLCVAFLPFFDPVFKVSVFVLCSTPCAAVILSLAEMHDCAQKLSANIILLSTILCVVTIPLLMLIII